VTAATFSADGRRAAFGGHAGVEVVEYPARRRIRFFAEAHVNDHALALSPDGALLAAAGRDNRVRLWDVAVGTERAALEVGGQSTALAFSPQGDLLAIGGDNLSIAVWEFGKRRWAWRKVARGAAGQVRGLAFSGDGRLLVSGARVDISGGAGEAGDIWLESPRIWDVATGVQVAALDEGQSLVGITSDGRRVIGAGGTAVRVWDRTSGAEIATLPHWPERTSGPAVTGVGLTPDGSRAISLGSDDGTVMWILPSRRVHRRLPLLPSSRIRDVALMGMSPGTERVPLGAPSTMMLNLPGETV
jgi:WD40 repeat protein